MIVINKTANLTRGFDDIFNAPHSIYTEAITEKIIAQEDLEILIDSKLTGPNIIASIDRRSLFVTGHPEYDREIFKAKYDRDIGKGLGIDVPYNYFTDDDPKKDISVSWKSHANLLYANWINYYIYQETEYDLNKG